MSKIALTIISCFFIFGFINVGDSCCCTFGCYDFLRNCNVFGCNCEGNFCDRNSEFGPWCDPNEIPCDDKKSRNWIEVGKLT